MGTSYSQNWQLYRAVTVLIVCAALSACASQKGNVADPEDPWEPMNRSLYGMNDAVDKVSLKPIAKGYRKVVPSFARNGISNFYDNLGTPLTMINNFLQGKPGDGFSDFGRFVVNSTVGIGGLFDVATPMGLEQHDEDFGQTFAVWGVPNGPYVLIPILGSYTLRDAVALPLDFLSDPLWYYRNLSVRDKLWILEIIDIRMKYLSIEGPLEKSFDPYITIRDAYLQNRKYEIYDGSPPEEDFYDDFIEDDEADQ